VTSSERLPLYWKVCSLNGAVFAVATAILVLSPATVSPQVTGREVVVLVVGLAVILAVNAVVLRGTLAPLDRLSARIATFDTQSPGMRLLAPSTGVAATLAKSFNELLDRLEAERRGSNARALEAQETERQRIARELHDEVGQRLTVVLLELTTALDASRSGHDVAGHLALARESTRASLDEVGRIVRGLRPGVLEDLGLPAALTEMLDDVARRGHLVVERQVTTSLPALSSTKELVLFRVAQEALTNVARHAGASRVRLCLSAQTDAVHLEVCDDGAGAGGLDTRRGDGIRGMRERALAVGGTLNIDSTPEHGTRVLLTVPFSASSRDV
jgi:two-component system sensor histidine kinase UhpB